MVALRGTAVERANKFSLLEIDHNIKMAGTAFG